MELIKAELVRPRIFKIEENIQVMERSREHAQAVTTNIRKYVRTLEENDTSQKPGPKYALKGYREDVIKEIILNVNIPDLSPLGKFANRFRTPSFRPKFDESLISVPSTKIDLSRVDANNIRQVLETLYQVQHIAMQLEGFIKRMQPDEVAGFVPAGAAGVYVRPPDYVDGYLAFLKKYNMWMYASVWRLKDRFPLNDDETSSTKQEQVEVLLSKAAEFARNEEAKERSLLDAGLIEQDHLARAESQEDGDKGEL